MPDTDRTFRRYNILYASDLRAAITKTEAYLSALPAERKVSVLAKNQAAS